MGELTEKEKAQKYDEAIRRAKISLGCCDSASTTTKNLVYDIFPELKNKDEEIRKAIIEFFELQDDNTTYSLITKKDILAWLEKQADKDKLIKELDEYKVKYTQEVLTQQLENRSKQTNVDKVNPKFNVGDWIVNNIIKDVFLIKSINNGYYTLEDIKGNIISPCLPHSESESHIWTIQDAKDGDVLIDKSHVGECVFIFKEARPSDIKTDVNNPLAIIGYCGINHIGFTSQLSGLGFGDTVNCTYYPATKEQRDLLFQKMKEAGYEWNAEKKELKKIEETINGEDYGIDGLWHAQRILEKTLGSVDGYQSDDGILEHKAAITAVKKLYEQKPDWNYEDEANLNNIIWLCNNCINGSETAWIPSQAKKIKHLIETVKERGLSQQKPTEWTEEDEKMLHTIIADFKGFKHDNTSTLESHFNECIDWLKLLKDRVQPQDLTITDEELVQAKKDAYNDALDKIEYHSDEPTFDDGWCGAIDYIRKKFIRPQNV